jgi:phosphate transport system substrate-binding protein
VLNLKKTTLLAAAVTMALGSTGATAQTARDYIYIVGSSTVFPFATAVAEQFGKATKFKTPKIESTGSGGGIKLFCDGIGVQHPDVVNSSRRIKQSEVDTCAKNGVTDIVEVKIGFDGIVLASSKKSPPMKLSLKDIYLALAKDVPDPKGGSRLVPNPYLTWKDVNPGLPDKKIEVLGPPPTSGTRDAFVELAMEGGCKQVPYTHDLEKADPKAFKAACFTVREDGAFIEAGENDNLIVQKLEANPNAYGIFGYSYLEQNMDRLEGEFVEGVVPEFETISSGKYPLSRMLYIYVKKTHADVIPGIREYLTEFTSDKASGPEGYLADKGLIPLPEKDRKQVRDDAKALKTLALQ